MKRTIKVQKGDTIMRGDAWKHRTYPGAGWCRTGEGVSKPLELKHKMAIASTADSSITRRIHNEGEMWGSIIFFSGAWRRLAAPGGPRRHRTSAVEISRSIRVKCEFPQTSPGCTVKIKT